MTYVGWDNREYEDSEMDAMREDAREKPAPPAIPEIRIWETATDLPKSGHQRKQYFCRLVDDDAEVDLKLLDEIRRAAIQLERKGLFLPEVALIHANAAALGDGLEKELQADQAAKVEAEPSETYDPAPVSIQLSEAELRCRVSNLVERSCGHREWVWVLPAEKREDWPRLIGELMAALKMPCTACRLPKQDGWASLRQHVLDTRTDKPKDVK